MRLKHKFFQELDKCIEKHSALLLDGQCPDMIAYARMCGVIYGLRTAKSEYEDILSSSVELREELEESV